MISIADQEKHDYPLSYRIDCKGDLEDLEQVFDHLHLDRNVPAGLHAPTSSYGQFMREFIQDMPPSYLWGEDWTKTFG